MLIIEVQGSLKVATTDIVKPIELGDINFVLTLRKQVSRFPPTRE